MILDDFFARALIAGVGVALVTGPLGCFIVWRRMAYFGDTMAHSALLGVAFGLAFGASLSLGVVLVTVAVALLLVVLEQKTRLASDTLLGILSHAALSFGLVAISAMALVRVDLLGYLFGDILAVTTADLCAICGGGLVVLLSLAAIWRPLLALTVHEDLARAEGVSAFKVRLIFMLLIAIVTGVAIKIVGVLMITSLLIVPAATARRWAGTPESMAVIAAVCGAAAVILGLLGSLTWDTPSGPSIVVAATAVFGLSLLPIGVLTLGTGARPRNREP